MDTPTAPVGDSVAKVANEVAVGEDLEFQRRWWRFEKAVWIFFALIVMLDLAGVFGRGPVAKTQKQTVDGMLQMNYERVERFSTPSILTLHFSPGAVQNGAVKLWVSDSVLKTLGNQRIIPEPASSTTTDGGILYSFASGARPSSVEFALAPARPGMAHFTVRLVSDGQVNAPTDFLTAGVFVMP